MCEHKNVRHPLRLPTRSEGVVSAKPLCLDLEHSFRQRSESFRVPAIQFETCEPRLLPAGMSAHLVNDSAEVRIDEDGAYGSETP